MDGFPKDRSFIDAIVESCGRECPHSLDAGWIISLAIVTLYLKNSLLRTDLRELQSINSPRTYRVYEIKIDKSHLNSESEERLCIMFLEAKLLYNYVLSQDNIFNLDFDIPISSLNSGISIIFER